jgi:TDG/mug DNA glycosylase family protein
VDPQTRAVYEASAADWVARRRPRDLELAEELAARSTGPSVDLGCGPGWHSIALPSPVVALDAARSMLEQVPLYAPHALRVQADLRALPFHRGALGAAWARHSYVHVARHDMPLALADLHRSLRVGAAITLRVFLGEGEGRDLYEEDDFPGRFFSRWDPTHLLDVITGAGFAIEDDQRSEDAIAVSATRARTLPDYVGPELRLLLCGLNPSLRAADAGVGFVSPSNRFWPAALAAGIVSRDRDPWHAVSEHSVGFTDLVKRATVGAAELSASEYRDGWTRVERLAEWLQPDAICFVGLSGYRAAADKKAVAGWQERTVGGRPAYVMPNPSGLNARTSVADLAAHLRRAASLA